MKRETILYISDQATSGDARSAALNAAGYEVVTSDTTEAIAMLYILHSVAAVVLARDQASFGVRSIRAICPDVPIVLLCRSRIDCVPPRVDSLDAYVIAGQLHTATLAAAVRCLIAKKPTTLCPRRS